MGDAWSGPWRAWYSEAQSQSAGTYIYRREDGAEVVASEVCSDLDARSLWPDAVDLGVVVAFVRVGRLAPEWHRGMLS